MSDIESDASKTASEEEAPAIDKIKKPPGDAYRYMGEHPGYNLRDMLKWDDYELSKYYLQTQTSNMARNVSTPSFQLWHL
jgi:hypothetical protein